MGSNPDYLLKFFLIYLSRLLQIIHHKIRIQPSALNKVVHPTYDASLLKVYNPAGSLAHSSAPYIVVVYNVQFHLLGIAIRLILLALRWEKLYLSQTNGHPLSYIALLGMMGHLNVQCQATHNFMIIPPFWFWIFTPFIIKKILLLLHCI